MVMMYFYQSTNAVNTLVDLTNAAHRELFRILLSHDVYGKLPPKQARRANVLMKKIGLKAGYATDFLPHTRWSCDISVVVRDDKGLITQWL